MKSKNNLSLTGIMSTDIVTSPERRSGRFTLVHNYGGDTPPLFLPCLIPGRRLEDALASRPAKGTSVFVEASVKPLGNKILAIIKRINIIY